MRSPLAALAALAAATAPLGALAQEGPPPPPFARPGQCFAKLVEPARFETVRDRVLVSPGRTDTRVIPARRHWEDRPVLLEPERREPVSIPPVLRTVSAPVVVRPATVRTTVIPAEYRDVAETVMVSPPRRYWRRSQSVPGYGPTWVGRTRMEPTGEVVCLVEEPARYETVWRRVCVHPEQRVDTPVPAEVRYVSRQVVAEPGRTEERVIPARWGSQRVEVVDVPERVERIDTPPAFREVERQRQVAPERVRWVETACAPAPPPPCPAACAPAYAPPPPPPPCGDDPCAAGPGGPGEPGGYEDRPERPGPAPRARRVHSRWRPAARAAGRPSGNPVADMQRALAARGYYRGPIDGLFTPAAGDALHRFQRDQGLAPGPLTHQSARRLGVER